MLRDAAPLRGCRYTPRATGRMHLRDATDVGVAGGRQSHERESAAASHHMLDDLLATGAGVLSNLGVQRDRLKSVHRKIRDVLQTTGLSDRLLRVAQRRQGNDKLLVYGGMLFILCFLWLMWRWAR